MNKRAPISPAIARRVFDRIPETLSPSLRSLLAATVGGIPAERQPKPVIKKNNSQFRLHPSQKPLDSNR